MQYRPPFQDRHAAGVALAKRLAQYAGRPDVVVLALSPGGVPVACEIAHALDVPLDVFIVRPLGVPGYEEMSMGGLVSGESAVVNDTAVRALHISDAEIALAVEREQPALRRLERRFRDGRPSPAIAGRTVILVDDGLSSTVTVWAAAQALKQKGAARVIVAVPVSWRGSCDASRVQADQIVCATAPDPGHALGPWYADSRPMADEEVHGLLVQTDAGHKAVVAGCA